MNIESRLFDLIEKDFRVSQLPLESRMFWLHMGRLMQRLGSSTSFRFGGPFATVSHLAVWIRVSTEEATSQIELLVRAGALLHTDDGLDLPSWAADTAKARAARENGKKGGRPAKAALHEQAPAPVAKADPGSIETKGQTTREPTKTQPRLSISSSYSSSPSSSAPKQPASARLSPPVSPWARGGMVRRTAEAIGAILKMDPKVSVSTHSLRYVKAWLDLGVDVEWLKQLAEERIALESTPNMFGFGWFNEAVMDQWDQEEKSRLAVEARKRSIGKPLK